MADQTPLAVFDAFLDSLPGKGRAVFETQALLSYVPDRKTEIGFKSAEEFHDLYKHHFTERDGQTDNWLGKILFLKAMVDYLIWNSLDPKNIEEHNREVNFLRQERRSDDDSNFPEMIAASREEQRQIWDAKREEWEALREGALGYAALDAYRAVVFLESAKRLQVRMPEQFGTDNSSSR